MLRPSSLPLGVRSVEWLRTHHFRWLVNDVERLYYTWTAPKKGGPQLRTLPKLPTLAPPPKRARPRHAAVIYRPPRIRSVLHPSIGAEGVWQPAGPAVRGAPAIRIAEYRPEPDYPRIVAYVAWIDHTRTQLALYPGRYEPPNASPAGRSRFRRGSAGACSRPSTAASPTGTATAASPSTAHRTRRSGRHGHGRRLPQRPSRRDLVAGRSSPGRGSSSPARTCRCSWKAGARTPRSTTATRGATRSATPSRVWRSGVGIDRHGNLIYAAADYQTAGRSPRSSIHAGAVRAIELDINAEWPSFITYPLPVAATRPSSSRTTSSRRRATSSPDDRDFFAVYRPRPGRSRVRCRSSERPAGSLRARRTRPGESASALVASALRVRQWVEEPPALCGAALCGSAGRLDELARGRRRLRGVLPASSAAYLVNDVCDADRDRLHPVKRLRPVARGALSPRSALVTSGSLLAVALGIGAGLGLPFVLFLAGFVLLQLAYSLALKHIVVLDVAAIAALFVLRAAAGAAAIHVRISPWLLLCTALLALFLALAKRRGELLLVRTRGGARPPRARALLAPGRGSVCSRSSPPRPWSPTPSTRSRRGTRWR